MNPTQTGQGAGGVVSGLLNGQDFQGRGLTYAGGGETAKGTVTIDPTTGAFTYTPNPEFAAAGGVDFFFASASNTAAYQLPGVVGNIQQAIHKAAQYLGFAQPDTTTKLVAVTVVVNGPTLIDIVGVVGEPVGQPLLSADGKRSYQTTTSYDNVSGSTRTTVAVIDTVTGKLIGSPVTYAGERLGALMLSKDGTRAIQTLRVDDSIHTVVVIDTTTGTVVGEPTVLADQQAAGLLQISSDGTRAFQATKSFDQETRTWSTTVTTINTVTGAVIGAPVVAGSAFASTDPRIQQVLQFSADGKQAYISTTSIDSDTVISPAYTRVAVIDVSTGTLVGAPVTLDGSPTGGLAISPDGSLLFRVTTIPASDGTSTTVVGVIDTVTGALATAATTLSGYSVSDVRSTTGYTSVVFSPDGTHAFLTTNVYDPATSTDKSQVAMFDGTTGTYLGITATIDGQARVPLQWSASDPSHLFQTVTHYGTGSDPDTTTIAVLRAVDGTLVGSADILGQDSIYRGLEFNADGTRAFLVTTQNLNYQKWLYISEIDTTTGNAIGTSTKFDGVPVGGLQFGASGNYVYQLVSVGAGDPTTTLAIINTATGTGPGPFPPVTSNGSPVGLQFTADRSRVFLTTSTELLVLETVNATQIAAFSFDGDIAVGAVVFSKDGTRAYQTTTTGITGKTTVSVYSTDTGAKLGTWGALSGRAFSGPILSADGSRAYLTTAFYNATSGWTTQVTVVDTSLGVVVGTPVKLSGPQQTLPWLNADGTRLVQTIQYFDSQSHTWQTGVAVIDTGLD